MTAVACFDAWIEAIIVVPAVIIPKLWNQTAAKVTIIVLATLIAFISFMICGLGTMVLINIHTGWTPGFMNLINMQISSYWNGLPYGLSIGGGLMFLTTTIPLIYVIIRMHPTILIKDYYALKKADNDLKKIDRKLKNCHEKEERFKKLWKEGKHAEAEKVVKSLIKEYELPVDLDTPINHKDIYTDFVECKTDSSNKNSYNDSDKKIADQELLNWLTKQENINREILKDENLAEWERYVIHRDYKIIKDQRKKLEEKLGSS